MLSMRLGSEVVRVTRVVTTLARDVFESFLTIRALEALREPPATLLARDMRLTICSTIDEIFRSQLVALLARVRVE